MCPCVYCMLINVCVVGHQFSVEIDGQNPGICSDGESLRVCVCVSAVQSVCE